MVENNVEKVNDFVLKQNERGEQDDVVINCISELLRIMTVAKESGEVMASTFDLGIIVTEHSFEVHNIRNHEIIFTMEVK